MVDEALGDPDDGYGRASCDAERGVARGVQRHRPGRCRGQRRAQPIDGGSYRGRGLDAVGETGDSLRELLESLAGLPVVLGAALSDGPSRYSS
jgi:hypothetical protein